MFLREGLGGLALAEVEVGGGQRVVFQQRGVEGQLGVLGATLDALLRPLLPLGLVVEHQRAAVGQAVDAVQPAAQRDGAQAHLAVHFAVFEARAGGLVPGQPLQVAVAQLGPQRLEGQELVGGQGQLARGLVGAGV